MKTISDISGKKIFSLAPDKIVICEYINTPEGAISLDKPILSSDHHCKWCGGKEHYLPWTEERAWSWLCANVECLVYEATKLPKHRIYSPIARRGLEWRLFCEIHDIGDLYYDVKFDQIHQNEDRLKSFLEFSCNPKGMILMQGDPGTGKTYAALGICELFTRKSRDAIFITQHNMSEKWLATFKSEKCDPFIDKITKCALLVIDDFGIGEISPNFLKVIMELLNTRLQWSNRGTVITTNLNNMDLSNNCGQALLDRIATGQKFNFKGNSRRRKAV